MVHYYHYIFKKIIYKNIILFYFKHIIYLKFILLKSRRVFLWPSVGVVFVIMAMIIKGRTCHCLGY